MNANQPPTHPSPARSKVREHVDPEYPAPSSPGAEFIRVLS